jgi:predicted transcriptional regulator
MKVPSGEEIQSVRKSQGLTQSAVAERAGVSQPLIARIETGDVDPRVSTLYSIVSALNGAVPDVDQEKVKISMPSIMADARHQAGFTQSELAEVAGVSQPLISRIERQDVDPRASTLREIFRQLDPAPGTASDADSSQTPIGSGLIEQITAELEEDDTQQPAQPDTAVTETESDNSVEECANCGGDLGAYPDPNYCPACGTQL